MKLSYALTLLCFVTLAFKAIAEELPLAGFCDELTCRLPSCRCSTSNIPGGLAPRNTPQFVVVTFDDSVNLQNIVTYRDILYDRRNSNGCPAGATFYVSHEYTNYALINELYNRGFEIALHSITHQTPQTYWSQANRTTIEREFADQKLQMSHFANIPLNAIQGMRMPFLQLAGNASFDVMRDMDVLYDASWPTITFSDPGLWPYTLNYASTQDCLIPPCPTASIPGPWVFPMIIWRDLEGFPCTMADACFAPPDLNNENAWFNFITRNFERHYFSNRAPFGFYVHEWFLRINPAVARALNRFLNVVNNLHDAFAVNSREVIEWVRNPIPVNEWRTRPCRWHLPTTCNIRFCGPLPASHTMEQFWMQICNGCPRVYPWRENPLGV